MSLQVWLPLNGDLKNQGLSDITVTNSGATVNNNGKIGKCYYFNNKYLWGNLDYSSFNTEFSVAFWYKITTAFSGNKHIVCLANTNGWAKLIFTCAATANNVFSFNIGNNSTSERKITCPYITGQWQHICFTFNNKVAKVYINGILQTTATYTINPNWSNIQKFGIGGTPSGQEVCTTLFVNDVRIYNHALSYKEVKEIAKGLILHYPLNKPMPNLLSKYVTPGQTNPGVTTTAGRTNYLGNYSIQIPATENADTYFRLFLTKKLIQNNKYTFSCYVSGLKKGTYYNFPFFAQGNTGMGVIHLDHNGLNTVTFTMNGSAQNAITDPEGKTVYIMFMDDSGRSIASGQQPFQVTQMKLEEGDKATGFIPNEYDPQYAAAGYASGIVYDCSGYQNNGIEVGTITGSSDTPRYRSSEYFDGSSCIKNIVVPFDSSVCNREMTTSCWIKKTIQDNNVERAYINYIMRLFVYTNGKFRINWNHATDNLSYNITNTWDTGIDVPYNKWTHVVFTFQEGIMKIYIDGVLRNTSDRTNNANRIRGYIGQCIGANNDSFTTSFIGNISDVRVYATALSAADVKALYNDAGYVDKNGNFHAYEFVEI